jgi:hypothetical protein
LRSPFPENSPHDDWEFVIRLTRQLNARIETVPDVLVIHAMGGPGNSLSNKDAWKASLNWLIGMRPIMTPRAYSGFCLGVVGPRAAKEKDYAAILPLLWHALRHGSPNAVLLFFFVAVWLLPEDFRRRLRMSLRPRSAGVEGRTFFFEKKNQKTFVPFAAGPGRRKSR